MAENLGWQCPQCLACFAPTVEQCLRCRPLKVNERIPIAKMTTFFVGKTVPRKQGMRRFEFSSPDSDAVLDLPTESGFAGLCKGTALYLEIGLDMTAVQPDEETREQVGNYLIDVLKGQS